MRDGRGSELTSHQTLLQPLALPPLGPRHSTTEKPPIAPAPPSPDPSTGLGSELTWWKPGFCPTSRGSFPVLPHHFQIPWWYSAHCPPIPTVPRCSDR